MQGYLSAFLHIHKLKSEQLLYWLPLKCTVQSNIGTFQVQISKSLHPPQTSSKPPNKTIAGLKAVMFIKYTLENPSKTKVF